MEQSMTLGEASARFLAGLSPAEREKGQQEVGRFARWIGLNRTLDQIKPPDIGRYGEQISTTSSDPAALLEPVRAFLAYCKKQGLTATNLAVHLRVKKTAASRALSKARKVNGPAAEEMTVSPEGYVAIETELRTLEEERPKVVEEIRKAAADKDFRENAPLHAARERQGYLEGRIRELEATLKAAKVVQTSNGDRIGPGDYVILKEVGCEDELCITVVHATEANAAKAKISLASPMGKALIGHRPGDTIEVAAPGGNHRYLVAEVERKGS